MGGVPFHCIGFDMQPCISIHKLLLLLLFVVVINGHCDDNDPVLQCASPLVHTRSLTRTQCITLTTTTTLTTRWATRGREHIDFLNSVSNKLPAPTGPSSTSPKSKTTTTGTTTTAGGGRDGGGDGILESTASSPVPVGQRVPSHTGGGGGGGGGLGGGGKTRVMDSFTTTLTFSTEEVCVCVFFGVHVVCSGGKCIQTPTVQSPTCTHNIYTITNHAQLHPHTGSRAVCIKT